MTEGDKKKLIIIAGPTAIGKTAAYRLMTTVT